MWTEIQTTADVMKQTVLLGHQNIAGEQMHSVTDLSQHVTRYRKSSRDARQ